MAQTSLQRKNVRGIVTMDDEATGAGDVIKIEGRSALPRKLEDESFRRHYIGSRPPPPGRDIWNDNDRLDIRFRNDPLTYKWPESNKDLGSYDPVLKKHWEDRMFALKWDGKANSPVEGGDWANWRVSTDVPPRIKIYYANIVHRFQEGLLMSATKVFNDLLNDYLAPRGSIPYGVYHTMLLVYKKRERYSRALDMFHEIVSWHTPTADDYALGMEVLLKLNFPRDALEVWQSFMTRPSIKPNALAFSMLLRTYARLGESDELRKAFVYAEQEARKRHPSKVGVSAVQAVLSSPSDASDTSSTSDLAPLTSSTTSPIDFLFVFTSMIEVYGEIGYAKELVELVEPLNATFPIATLHAAIEAFTSVGLHQKAVDCWKQWLDKKDLKDIKYFNPLIKSLIALGDIAGIEAAIADLKTRGVAMDMNTYVMLIQNRFQLSESTRLTQLVNNGIELKDVRPSIRNYRRARAANISAHASAASPSSSSATATADSSVATKAMGELESKGINIDAEFFDSLMSTYANIRNLTEAVKLWRSHVVEGEIVPPMSSFKTFFKLAGSERDLVNVALMWRVAKHLHVSPDFDFAASLTLGLQPDRNYFGLKETRAAHKKWTTVPFDETSGASLGPRILNKHEIQELDKFIDHVISTFPESDRTKLEKAWAEMEETFAQPLVEVTPEDDPQTASRPVEATEGSIKRIFADKLMELPKPFVAHSDEEAPLTGAATPGEAPGTTSEAVVSENVSEPTEEVKASESTASS